MDPKIFILLGFLAVSVALIGIAITLPTYILPYPAKLVVLIVALIFDVIAFSSRRYSYLIIPMLKQRRRNIIISVEEPYWLSSSDDSIIKREKGEYVATAYISIPTYRSATEMSDEEKIDFSRQVSRLVGISSDPIRFTAELYMMNKDSYIQTLRDAMSAAENEESQLLQSANPGAALDVARGKIAMWRNVLESSSRAPSIELISYAAISAAGSKEYEAVSMVQQKAREVISGISTTFGVTPSVVTGRDILKFVDPEQMAPFSTITTEIEQKTEREVV